MRWSLLLLGTVVISTFALPQNIGVASVGAQQLPAQNTQKEAPAGKVAWQYNTGG
jgi:hypothetical protein